MPKAYNVLSWAGTYTWPSPAEIRPESTYEVTVLPLFHNGLPVVPSRACSTAEAVLPAPGAPLARTKTTPFTTIGDAGRRMSLELQAGRSVTAPFSSTTLNACRPPPFGPFQDTTA